MKIVTVAPTADQNARLAAIWRVLSAAEHEHRERYAAILARGESILRQAGNAVQADVLADARRRLGVAA